jgi:hypothetical protein
MGSRLQNTVSENSSAIAKRGQRHLRFLSLAMSRVCASVKIGESINQSTKSQFKITHHQSIEIDCKPTE